MSRVSSLLDRARAAAGFDDFGDESFREGLDRLVASADAQARLNERGRAMLDGQIVDLLFRRLEIERWYALHPEIDAEEIVAPLIGLGLPRTGSTAFSFLLAQDPGVRYLRTWESNAPCPPPEQGSEDNDPRIAEAEARIEATHRLFPRMKAMLPSSATGPMECQNFMGYDFKAQLFIASVRVPDYVRWLLYEADLVPTYRYVKRVLKLLQWRCPPKRWRLKNPSHTAFIDALDRVFPDAHFWMTHRDITRVLPSNIDLYGELSRLGTDELDRGYLADVNVEWWETGINRMLRFRDGPNDRRFFDVRFDQIQADPLRAVEDLYAFLGEELTPEARARMDAWQRDTPADKHGRHDYDAAALGIDLVDVAARFRPYSDRFGLA